MTLTQKAGLKTSRRIYKLVIFIVCIFLSILSIFPFLNMVVNATRGTYEIQQSAVSIIPSTHLLNNLEILTGKGFDALIGFMNSMIISIGATVCALYFSSLTAYGLVVYNWKLRRPFFTFIMLVLMLPPQVLIIGFYQFIYSIHWTNSYWPLIIPAIASPALVFFMRQYLLATLSLDIVNSARVDGANEFYIYNRIVLPMMKPALAVQGIFVFVFNWNQLFIPLILLTEKRMKKQKKR
jgi:multiple sugar transport system permease protein